MVPSKQSLETVQFDVNILFVSGISQALINCSHFRCLKICHIGNYDYFKIYLHFVQLLEAMKSLESLEISGYPEEFSDDFLWNLSDGPFPPQLLTLRFTSLIPK